MNLQIELHRQSLYLLSTLLRGRICFTNHTFLYPLTLIEFQPTQVQQCKCNFVNSRVQDSSRLAHNFRHEAIGGKTGFMRKQYL
jgi:hypothetical protein